MSTRRIGTLYVVCAALLWSTGGIGIKGVHDPALKVTFYRSLFAAIALMIFLPRDAWAARRWRSNTAFAIAVISYAACLTTFVVATKWTTAANAIFLQYAGAVWVLLLSPIIVHEPIRGRDVAAITLAIGGMALFFFGRIETRGMSGNAMALLSSVFFASLILSLRRDQHASQAAVTWGNLVCAVTVLPFIIHDLALTLHSLVILALLGFFQVALAYAFFTRGLAYVTATQASLTGMLEPIANPLWVFLFLGERPSSFAVAGAAVVLAAIGWHTLSGDAVADMPAVD
jgi:drug/metabolite transporter (DMT)-like permease